MADHDLDAERAVLGGILIDPPLFAAAQAVGIDAAFYRVAHRHIWHAMTRLTEAGTPIDLLTVRGALEAAGHLDEVTPLYLTQLIDGVPRSMNVGAYAEIVREKARGRALVAALDRAKRAVLEQGITPEIVASLTTAAVECGRAEALAPATDPLTFSTLPELAARIRAAGPRGYLMKPVWPAADYGMLGGEPKAQKSWTALDAAVSVASGTPWLGHFPIDTPGPVLVFSGEGSEGTLWRRLCALATARGLDAETLPIVVCCRAPHLSNAAHLALVKAQIATLRPTLVEVDPLYLSARGAKGADLYAMGEVLEGIQHVCQQHGASLLVVHHFNRKEGSGAARFSGAGPAEWGRVLLTLDVRSRHTDPETKETTVITEMQAIGGDIADQAVRIVRRVRADDPDDLGSALVVSTTVEAVSDHVITAGADTLAPAAQKLLDALREAPAGLTQPALVDAVAKRHGHGLKRETVSRHLNDLERRGLVRSTDAGPFQSKIWRPCDLCDVTRDLTPEGSRVIACDPPIGDHAPRSHEDDHTVLSSAPITRGEASGARI